MRTITLSEDATEMRQAFEQAHEEAVILQLADGRQFILSAIDEFDSEIAQTRQNQKLLSLLDQRAESRETISLDAVKRQLGLSEAS